jgi:hypothetical protein
MDSSQTLHDFVLNLLTNPDARSAFELDPEGALHNAGLNDLTVADVHDVVPLVVDYAPALGITSLAPVESLALGGLDADPTAVISQLQAVAANFTVGTHSTNGNATAFGAITADTAGFGVAASGLPAFDGLGVGGLGVGGLGVGGLNLGGLGGLGVGGLDLGGSLAGAGTNATADLSGGHDVSATLDSGALGTAGHEVGAVAGTGGDLVGTAHGLAGTVDGLGGGVTGGTIDFTVHTATSTVGDVTHVTDSVAGVGHDAVAGVNLPTAGGLDPSALTSGVTGTAHGLGAGLGGVTGGLGLDSHGPVETHTDTHVATDGGLLGLH